MERREFMAAITAALAAPASRAFAQASTPSLKDACKDMFVIGTALDFRSTNEFNPTELDLIQSQFNGITPENSMKPGPVHPQENSWNWTQPDALVDFCQTNNIKTFGHCLVWHSQTNPWFFQDADRDRALFETSRSHPYSGRALQRQDVSMGCRERGHQRRREFHRD